MSELLTCTQADGVACIAMDDGKANALSPAMIDALNGVLDTAAEADAVVLTGRPGRFCAGFDLTVMRGGLEAMRGLVSAGAELAMRLYGFPRPVVVACTGHALAAGGLLLLAADWRVGAAGDSKIGLNEVAIGITMPRFGVELAQARLSRRHLTAALTHARIYDPEGASDAGFLDELAPAELLTAAAEAKARELGALANPAYRDTKLRERGALIQRVRDGLAADMATWGA